MILLLQMGLYPYSLLSCEPGLWQFAEISMVALSTTLATNAIVEGKGCEVGVIMIGEKPMDKLPVEHYVVIDGGHDTEGVPYKQLDEAGLLQSLAILHFCENNF